MFSFTDRHCFLLAVVFYGLSTFYSVFLWRKGFRQDNRVTYGLLFAAAIFHTWAMVKRGFSLQHCPVNNLYEAITFVSWTIVVTYLAIGSWARLRFLGAFASPVLFGIGVFALFPELDHHGPKPEFGAGWQSLHAALILLAYGAFGLGSVAGAMYLTQEHDLKFHKLRAVFSLMPPIERLERVTTRLMSVGFILLTAGLALGAYSLRQKNGVFLSGDLKIVWSLFVWALYLGLLTMRWWFAQGGRRFAWGAVGSFAFILLTFWGTNLASRIHQP
ncbi:MAG: cytochrome c biogenesis protein [Verrucomicrobiales bacterium]|nr:cytochrome c biogenesis protein [Verrucomicrobiales bacterium]